MEGVNYYIKLEEFLDIYIFFQVLFTDRHVGGGGIIALNVYSSLYPHDEHRFLEYPGAVRVHRMHLLCFLVGSHLP